MIKFLLVLYFGAEEVGNEILEDQEANAILASEIQKIVEMPMIPRIGEYIHMGGNSFQVDGVRHLITERTIEVLCDVSLHEGLAAYAEASEGWNLDYLPPAAKDIFFRGLQQYKEKKEKVVLENL